INYMFGRNYFAAYDPSFFDTRWQDTYQRTLKNIRLLNQVSVENGLTKHVGMGQVFEAYLMITLVDFFGDVPYSQAFDIANLNPAPDSGASIYEKALELLDQAKVNFETNAPSQPTFDFYYQRDWSKWIKLTNSLKLKIYIQRRLVDPNAIASFESIISNGNYMTSIEDDFQFTWGTNNTNPDTRHPIYAANYTPTGAAGASGYMSNWLMNQMKNTKSVVDPRMRFYFYRQVNDVPVSEQDLRCTVEPIPAHYAAGNHVYCRIENNQGYWGRDHGNDEGLPPDGTKKTAYGLYPVGGRFDDNTFEQTDLNTGAKGNGITPIFLSSTIDFLRAEAALFGGSGDAKAFVQSGVQKSITKVRGFISRDAEANVAFVPNLSVDATYISEVGTLMDNAVGNQQKLNVIAKEFFVSLFGNGIDAYNFYRRTGAPTDIQPNIDPNPGEYIRSFFYPSSEANTNTNVNQKNNVTTRVFWDTNPLTGFPIGN
ncbi:MAG: SusD/RagB family nutrient-binding outer membrane lipoprotein, partial [Flavobacterium sp.]|nr:SusD/RagB family nutrient-binding outer membrane lipoprotein [Flavobacterium sp.]